VVVGAPRRRTIREKPCRQHDNEQFSCVLRGRIRFVLGEPGTAAYRETEVTAGEMLHLPGGVPHAAFAIEDSEVLDVFAPPSAETGLDRR
jgi:quercetin dioxygenase-like cupin family protein